MGFVKELPSKETVSPLHYDIFARSFASASEAGGVKIGVSRLEPGGHADPHVHEGQYQVFYILEGRVRMTYQGREELLASGMGLIVDPGEIHSISGVGEERARYLTMTFKPLG
ncbi:MAG: cupin domain-containing protein [Ignavibacteriales bacterium]